MPMKPLVRLSTTLIVLVAAATGVRGASEASTPPAPRTQGAVASPEVLPDRHVTFRLRAPDAHSVTISGQLAPGPVALSKDEAGVWSVTVGPLVPDLYEYSFSVDGLTMADPSNRFIKPTRNPRGSILEIPGEPPLLQDFQNVPHGKVSLHWYDSKALGRRRPMQVYTPPGYDADSRTRFPVLYLLHGSGDTEAMWVALGHAHWILDNLIAQKRAKPMLIVMIDGHAITTAGVTNKQNFDGFERDLLGDVMPFVSANYRVADDAEHRAIIGVSMGGYQSLSMGLKHPDLFAWIGGMSSSIMGNDDREETLSFIGNGDTLRDKLKLLWLGCGKEDRLVVGNRRLDEALTAAHIPHELVVSDGGHAWPVWRKFLPIFAPKLFRP